MDYVRHCELRSWYRCIKCRMGSKTTVCPLCGSVCEITGGYYYYWFTEEEMKERQELQKKEM